MSVEVLESGVTPVEAEHWDTAASVFPAPVRMSPVQTGGTG